MLLTYGANDSRIARDSKKMYEILERARPKPEPDQKDEDKDLVRFPISTTLQGTELLTKRQFKMVPKVAYFITSRLENQPHEWSERHE